MGPKCGRPLWQATIPSPFPEYSEKTWHSILSESHIGCEFETVAFYKCAFATDGRLNCAEGV
jgi:hypothetical protein